MRGWSGKGCAGENALKPASPEAHAKAYCERSMRLPERKADPKKTEAAKRSAVFSEKLLIVMASGKARSPIAFS